METQSASLARLNHVEKRIVQAVELAGSVMEELASVSGPRKDVVAAYCQEFMKSIKEIQTGLHAEIKSMCEYRPYEYCDYVPRLEAEICAMKLESIRTQVEKLQETVEQRQQ